MVNSLGTPFKLYQKSAPSGVAFSGRFGRLLTPPASAFAAPLAAIAPPARKSNAVKIPLAIVPRILTAIFVNRDSQGGK